MFHASLCEDSFIQHIFMLNCHSCYRGNKTSVKYGMETHDINDYLNVDITDRYDGEEEDDYMINFFHDNMD